MKHPQPLHALVVEDHTPLRDQIVALLRHAGHRADEASSGRMALQMALEQPPDVLLLDIGLPELDGLGLCRLLRARCERHVPVLMLLDRQADMHLARRSGAEGWLVKPLDALRLRRATDAILAGGTYTEGLAADAAPVEPMVPLPVGDAGDSENSSEEQPATAG